jgi:hypothetical protein
VEEALSKQANTAPKVLASAEKLIEDLSDFLEDGKYEHSAIVAAFAAVLYAKLGGHENCSHTELFSIARFVLKMVIERMGYDSARADWNEAQPQSKRTH